MNSGAAHGLVYPSGFPGSLPEPAPNVRLLSTKAFEQLYLSHILAHPQDHVLFPFLHGLEGNNEAQNSFFATAPNARETHFFLNSQQPRVKVPRYRGLVCVVCEDDIEADGDSVSLRILRRKNGPTITAPSPSSSTYSTSSESFDDDFDIEGFSNSTSQDNHICVAGSDDGRMLYQHSTPMPLFHEQTKDKNVSPDPNNQSHMHPVSHRTIHPPVPAPLTLPSSVSSSTSVSSGTGFLFDNSTPSTSPVTDATSVSSAPLNLDTAPEGCILGLESEVKSVLLPPPVKVTDPAAPPLLTGTFRPKELLRRVKAQNGSFEWEFAPANVPDGISLRNFGIQVPIYATLSDIVVYSPKGASLAALTLGKRFARAIEIKREERLRFLGFSALPDEEDIHRLLKYNVFVLDATEDDMKKDLSHLMMHICVEPVTGGLFGRQTHTRGAHTDGPDGHVIELLKHNPPQASGDVIDMDVDGPLPAPKEEAAFVHNTVDFAQREKEEMQDLTKASEIISLFPTSLINTPVGSPGSSPLEERTSTPQQRHRSHSLASSHHPYRSTRPSHLQFLPQVQPSITSQQNISFSPPLTSNIDFSSTSSYFNPVVGQVFLGNSNDVPFAPGIRRPSSTDDDLFEFDGTNDPKRGLGFDICIECHELATFPSAAHLRAADEHLSTLDLLWAEKYERQMQERFDNGEEVDQGDILPRPPPNASAVIHLTLPSSPVNTQTTVSSLMPVIRFLDKWLRPVVPPTYTITRPPSPSPQPVLSQSSYTAENSCARRWSSVTSFMPSFSPFSYSPSPSKLSSGNTPATMTLPNRNRSLTSPSTAPIPAALKPRPRPRPTRPLKILMYSSDGYTESSVPALSLLMAIKGLDLPEAYLELQVAKRRSFFVYSNDLGILRRIETRLKEDRERVGGAPANQSSGGSVDGGSGTRGSLRRVGGAGNRPTAKSVSFAMPSPISGTIRLPTTMVQPRPPVNHVISQNQPHVLQEDMNVRENNTPAWEMEVVLQGESCSGGTVGNGGSDSGTIVKGRPRAKTSPWLPSTFSGDHQAWFNDPRFDGSFPSRVLPFLYLGNLNHAANAYMLHALGITHVVSVGECALVPPSTPSSPSAQGDGHIMNSGTCNPLTTSAHFTAGKGLGMQGNLWIEEREGRIKVLDIKGICDDGIDTLEPQLGPICEWIDKARQDGGQVLVHCRVGVSRSATVTIAYVMKYLDLPLVDAYLIVRSRRLSVLIQPNMRLLYNLCGWEIKLAKERACGNERKLKQELSRTLSWPYLAKEVHALNEKYLH